MKIEKLKRRLHQDRPMSSVTIRMPEDVIEDLKELAPILGFSGYQPLIRAYVGQGIRNDMDKLEKNSITAMVESLRQQGVSKKIINTALKDSSSSL